MKTVCLLCGVGGQGTVLATKILAFAAMEKGCEVRTSETIGMAQRGGCVVSHVRIKDTPIYSPLVPLHSADILIGFEPAEAVRCLPYLSTSGTVIVSKKEIRPITSWNSASEYTGSAMLSYLEKNCTKLIVIDSEKVFKLCGSSRVLNIALLAAAVHSGSFGGINTDDLKHAVKSLVKPQFHELNLSAIDTVIALIGEDNK